MVAPTATLGFLPSLSPFEIAVILVIVLLIFGPKSLPALGRSLGRGLREFKDATNKFSEAVQEAGDDDEKPAPSRSAAPAKLASEDRPSVERTAEKDSSSAPAGTVSTSPTGSQPKEDG